tara:strand:+ start:80 stop:823 length:744 start_codon:yes stop_codon:yes gene_type:complete
MSKQKFLERYSRQIILKDIGILGQKLISKAKILVVGAGGLGCPIAEYLSRAGIGTLGIVDFDKVQLSNIHRQSMYNTKDIGKFKVDVVQKKIKLINPLVKIKKIRKKINEKNIKNIVSKFDIIVDGSDNFKTKFLLNKYSIKFKKFYISGAISKFDGHIFTFNFKNKNEPCLRCFYQTEPSDDILNCETEGILGPVAAVVANIQTNEVIKKILNIGNNLKNHILIVNLKNLNFRKVKFNKKRNCICA